MYIYDCIFLDDSMCCYKRGWLGNIIEKLIITHTISELFEELSVLLDVYYLNLNMKQKNHLVRSMNENHLLNCLKNCILLQRGK